MEEEQTPNKEQQEIINKVTQGKNLGFFEAYKYENGFGTFIGLRPKKK